MTAALEARAENLLVASCLFEAGTFERVSHLVADSDFADQELGAVWALMRSQMEQGTSPHWGSVQDAFEALGNSDAAEKAVAYAQSVPTNIHVEYYARQVAQASIRRRALLEAQKTIALAGDASVQTDDVIKQMGDAYGRVQLLVSEGKVLDPLAMAEIAMNQINRRKDGDPDALSFGFPALDQMTSGGALPGQLIIVGGRTSMGKSSLMRDFARQFAVKGTVFFASNEMTASQIADRDLAVYSGIPLTQIQGGWLSQSEQQRTTKAAAQMAEVTIYTHVDGGMTTASLRAELEGVRRKTEIKAIVVDYIQMMSDGSGDARTNEVHRIAGITKALKRMALDFKVPVIAGSQLSRNPERNARDYRPQLTDLRDSGALEQDADMVLLLYRPGAYWPNESAWRKDHKDEPYPENEGEIIIAKQRQGVQNATVYVAWVPHLAHYVGREKMNQE